MAPPNHNKAGKHEQACFQKERELDVLDKQRSWPPHSILLSFLHVRDSKVIYAVFQPPLSPRRVHMAWFWPVRLKWMWDCSGEAFAFAIKGVGHSCGILHSYLPLLPIWKAEAMPAWVVAILAWGPTPLAKKKHGRAERWKSLVPWSYQWTTIPALDCSPLDILLCETYKLL